MRNNRRAALLVVDVQRGLDDPRLGKRNNPDAEQHMAVLLSAWRSAAQPILHVQHMSVETDSPLRPDSPGNAFKPEVAPMHGEPVFRKTVSSAFTGTDLEDFLRSHGIDELVVVGLATDHCVSTTVRVASGLGFNVRVVADATATFERVGHDGDYFSADEMHRSALASLQEEFATIVDTADILGEEQ